MLFEHFLQCNGTTHLRKHFTAFAQDNADQQHLTPLPRRPHIGEHLFIAFLKNM